MEKSNVHIATSNKKAIEGNMNFDGTSSDHTGRNEKALFVLMLAQTVSCSAIVELVKVAKSTAHTTMLLLT